MVAVLPDYLDYDLQVRGAVDLSQKWLIDQGEVRQVWTSEQLVAGYSRLFERSFEIFDVYCRTGSFPNQTLRFNYFAEALALMTAAARIFLQRLGKDQLAPGCGDLEKQLGRAEQILDENNYATNMAMQNLAES